MTLRVDFTAATRDHQAAATLYANDRQVGGGPIAKPMIQFYGTLDHGLCCGYDDGKPVTRDYETPFAFTGEIRQVVIELTD